MNTLDLSAVAVLKELTHLPVLVDPGRAVGASRFVKPMALAAAAAGADGVLADLHDDPSGSVAAGYAALTAEQVAEVVKKCAGVRDVIS